MAYEFTRKTDNVDDVMAVDVNELQEALEAHEFLTLKAATELTIASGAITAVQASHKLQPESSTADNLDTINGMDAGDILVLYVSDAGTDTITIKHGTGNISCVGGDDIALSEGAVICYFDGTTVYAIGGGGGATPAEYLCQGRLTLESGVPISTTDQADKTTLYFTPFNGNSIDLYDGSSGWVRYTFTEKSLALGTLTASKPHDIFIYDNAGTLTLSATEWTNATTRATALTTQDGVYVKTGATGYRYLGTIYIDSGQKCQDTETKRFVWNYYNRLERRLHVAEGTQHTYGTKTYRKWNNSDTNNLIEFVFGVGQPIKIYFSAPIKSGADGKNAQVRPYLDGANISSIAIQNHNPFVVQSGNVAPATPVAGYHYSQLYEYADGTSGDATFYPMFIGGDFYG